MEILELPSTQYVEYKRFFMEGLIRDEERFRISPGDEEKAAFPTEDRADSFTLGAYLDGVLAGVVSFQREGRDREKLRHKGLLFRMYVSPEARGNGIAQALIGEVVARAIRLGDIERINLTVIAENAGAKRLYERAGFTTFATETDAIKWKGRSFTENQMVLRLP
jgi:cyclohexyl-isocyanide hydratase